MPFLLVAALASNAVLARSSWTYSILLLFQILLYCCGALGISVPSLQTALIVKIPTYFLSANASILFAWRRYLSGERIVAWTPTKR